MATAEEAASEVISGFRQPVWCPSLIELFFSCPVQFAERSFTLRDLDSHRVHCDKVEEDPRTYSREFGVNHRSDLMELQYFDICSGALLPDVMHDIFEGVLQYEAKLVLQHAINNRRYFSLRQLSEKISYMELGYMETTDRPTTITPYVLSANDRSLSQKGELLCGCM